MIMKNTILVASLVCSLLCFQSCGESEGCTDPNGENYNADAETDDGSCTYARTKFIGTYGAGESCDGNAAMPIVISIAESSSATNEIVINNETNGITIIGVVSGNNVSFNDTSEISGITINVIGNGTYSVSNGEESIDAEYVITQTNSSGQSSISSCISIWNKV